MSEKSVCPVCKTKGIQAREKFVCCESYKVVKEGKEYVNMGCPFHIFYEQDFFQKGFKLKPQDIKAMIDEGKEFINRDGDKLMLDLAENHYTRIERKEKVYETL